MAEAIGRALEFVPKERLFPCTNCGLAPMGRDVAWRKLQALAEGTWLAKEQLAMAWHPLGRRGDLLTSVPT